MRFQKRIKLFPGLTINLSKSGISTSVGARGAHVTLGHGKTRTTVGLPGTGLSHTDIQPASGKPDKVPSAALASQPPPEQGKGWGIVQWLVAGIIGFLSVANDQQGQSNADSPGPRIGRVWLVQNAEKLTPSLEQHQPACRRASSSSITAS